MGESILKGITKSDELLCSFEHFQCAILKNMSCGIWIQLAWKKEDTCKLWILINTSSILDENEQAHVHAIPDWMQSFCFGYTDKSCLEEVNLLQFTFELGFSIYTSLIFYKSNNTMHFFDQDYI